MPTISVSRDTLHKCIGKSFTQDEFDKLCFQFGIELDDVVIENDETIYKIDIPANRYDLLSVYGLGTALGVFLGVQPIPLYRLSPFNSKPQIRIFVKKEVSLIRPYVVGAVLRNITFTEDSLKHFIELQDKLHQTLARRRTLVAIGTHDLDTVSSPFTVEALPPSDISFIPLNQNNEMNGNEIMKFYESHQQLKSYLHIIKDSAVFPVIYDNNKVVCSLPPIINGDHSKVNISTKNIFIEMTGMDIHKMEICLQVLTTSFSHICTPSLIIEPVEVEYEKDHSHMGGNKILYPELQERKMICSYSYLTSLIGVSNISRDNVIALLAKMMLHVKKTNENDDLFTVYIPPSRSDILHPCDVSEDLAIAYGFDNIIEEPFPVLQIEKLNSLTGRLRRFISSCLYTEALNWGLCSIEEGIEWLIANSSDYENLMKTPNINTKSIYEYNPFLSPVELSNPKTKEFQITRTSLLSGLLKTLACNKWKEMPLRLFEIGDVCVLDNNTETKTRNIRHCAVLHSNTSSSGFEETHGILESLMSELGVPSDYNESFKKERDEINYYSLKESNGFSFLKNRSVDIMLHPMNIRIGQMGVIHPEVLKRFGVYTPTSFFELNIEVALKWLLLIDYFD